MAAIPQEELPVWEDVEEAADAQANSTWLKPRRLAVALMLVLGCVAGASWKRSRDVAATQETDQLVLLDTRDDVRGGVDQMKDEMRDTGKRDHTRTPPTARTPPTQTVNALGSCESICTSTASGCDIQCSTDSSSCNTQCSSAQWASDPAESQKHVQDCQKQCNKEMEKCSDTCSKALQKCNIACKKSK
eukprot:TRINITY_DN89554_c0_g1_i1.p2 TRINITY_DN89554_c0_g1~~TRINITY_DN89554_c0_g1_i1.p2  ORF type:complete len:189 (-),score=35.52 TRINITY_DN89554_c0_g1_i1:216-782(-)